MMNTTRDIFRINEATTALINGEFILDCPDMDLYRVQPENSPVYKGSGYIKQNSNGSLEFKLFSQEEFDYKNVLSEMLSNKPESGEIIPDPSYYVLKAIDLENREWTSKRIYLPDRNFSKCGKGIVIFGEFSTIYQEKSFLDRIEKPAIRIQILDDVSFPASSPTEYSILHGEQEVFKSIMRNAAEFESGDKKFFLLKHQDLINISVICQEGNFPNYFDTRVIEAIQFITSKRIKKTISETRENEKSKLRIQLIKGTSSNNRSHPPINYTSLDETGCIWKLFDKYLKYVSTYTQNDWHPFSSRIYKFIEGSSYSYFMLALILCTEIEGILKEEYSEIGNPSDNFLRLIGSVKKYFKKWKIPECEDADNDSESNIKDRINGLLGLLEQPRPIEKLRYLLNSGAVSEECVRAWQELRPMLAHAYDPDSEHTQDFLDKFFRTLVLFYQLIFYKIGYEGKFTDYSIRGWPFKNYPF